MVGDVNLFMMQHDAESAIAMATAEVEVMIAGKDSLLRSIIIGGHIPLWYQNTSNNQQIFLILNKSVPFWYLVLWLLYSNLFENTLPPSSK